MRTSAWPRRHKAPRVGRCDALARGILLIVLVMMGMGLASGFAGAQPDATPAPTPAPTPGPGAPQPCTGVDCLPQPGAAPVAPPAPPTAAPDSGGGGCGFTDIPACVSEAIDSFLMHLVTPALNRFLDLLAATLLTTPTPDQLPRIGQLWESSWQMVLALYATLILAAGIVVMAHETLQTRTSIKEVLPRIMVGFLAGALSLWIATQAITIANALARSFLAGGVDDVSAPQALKSMIFAGMGGALFAVVLGLVLAVMLAAVLLTYVVRVVLVVTLVAGAPLLLMFHAVPQTEGIARWWWKAFGGCLAVQLIQSFVLVTALRVFLAPGFTLLGPDTSGVVNMLVAIALMWVLIKVPFWVFSSLRVSNRRSFLGTLAKGVLVAKAFGVLRGLSGTTLAGTRRGRGNGSGGIPPKPGPGPKPTPRPGPGPRPRPMPGPGPGGPKPGPGPTPRPGPGPRPTPRPGPGSGPGPGPGPRSGPRSGPVDPYSRISPHSPGTRPVPAHQGRLPAGGEWPKNKSALPRNGHYPLPITAPPRPRSPTRPAPLLAASLPRAPRAQAARQRPQPLDLPRVRPPRPTTSGGDRP